MADNQKQGKKLPKRTSRPAHKSRREACWARGQKRKKQRQAAQDAAHRANVTAGTSPWQRACEKRAQRAK